MSKLGNIYGEHEILPRLFLAPFHRGQKLVRVYRILLSDSVMLLAIVMTIWALSTAMVSTRMAQPLKTDRVVGIDRPYVDMGTCNSPKEFGVVERSAGMAMQRQLLLDVVG